MRRARWLQNSSIRPPLKYCVKVKRVIEPGPNGNIRFTQSTLALLTSGHCVTLNRCASALFFNRRTHARGGRAEDPKAGFRRALEENPWARQVWVAPLNNTEKNPNGMRWWLRNQSSGRVAIKGKWIRRKKKKSYLLCGGGQSQICTGPIHYYNNMSAVCQSTLSNMGKVHLLLFCSLQIFIKWALKSWLVADFAVLMCCFCFSFNVFFLF